MRSPRPLRAIAQPLDLIMAAVDVKGTMKDFCSPACLLSFKSDVVSTQAPRRLCSRCNAACTVSKRRHILKRVHSSYNLLHALPLHPPPPPPQTMCQLTLNESVHTFCGNSCLGDFRRDNMADCEHCGATFCHEPLKLKLEEDKTVCSQECLDQLKEVLRSQDERHLGCQRRKDSPAWLWKRCVHIVQVQNHGVVPEDRDSKRFHPQSLVSVQLQVERRWRHEPESCTVHHLQFGSTEVYF